MKTSIKSTIVAAVLALLSTGAFAANKAVSDTAVSNGNISAELNYSSKNCQVDLDITNANLGNSAVTIYDADGNVVLTDKFVVTADKTTKTYLITDLEEGDYTIAVDSNNEVTTMGLTLVSDDEETTYAL